jgi:hypothetical protein
MSKNPNDAAIKAQGEQISREQRAELVQGLEQSNLGRIIAPLVKLENKYLGGIADKMFGNIAVGMSKMFPQAREALQQERGGPGAGPTGGQSAPQKLGLSADKAKSPSSLGTDSISAPLSVPKIDGLFKGKSAGITM